VAVATQPAPGQTSQPAGGRTGQQSIWGAGSTFPQGGASGGEVPVVCLSDDDEYSLRFHIRSRLGQRHGHQSTTLTSLFYNNLY
jgi:hypothetical protein